MYRPGRIRRWRSPVDAARVIPTRGSVSFVGSVKFPLDLSPPTYQTVARYYHYCKGARSPNFYLQL
jgi:hypothetical protein